MVVAVALLALVMVAFVDSVLALIRAPARPLALLDALWLAAPAVAGTLSVEIKSAVATGGNHSLLFMSPLESIVLFIGPLFMAFIGIRASRAAARGYPMWIAGASIGAGWVGFLGLWARVAD